MSWPLQELQVDYQRLLEGVARSSALMLKPGDVNRVLNSLVAEIGQAAQVDRCYIFKNFFKEGHVHLRQYCEWVAPGISRQIENQNLQAVSYDILPGLFGQLNQHMPYAALVKDSPDEHRMLMEEQEVVSYLLLPIFEGNRLWGLIGYDDCSRERSWSEAEVQTLGILANNIGSYLSRESLETALIEKNAKYELALKGSQAGIWELNMQGGRGFVSAQWRKMFGFTYMAEDGLTADLLSAMIHPNDRAMVLKRTAEYLNSGEGTLDLELRMQHAKGHYLWISSRSAAEWDENGRPIRYGGSDSDITERKIHEQLIEDNEKQYRNLVNNLTDVIFESDITGCFTFLNTAWESLTGYTVAESLGKRGSDFVYTDDSEIINQVVGHLEIDENLTISREFRYLRKDGRPVWVHMLGKKVFDDAGEHTGFSGIISNIQSRREAEIRLKESEEKYRIISENMTDLVTQHDFEGRITFVSNSVSDWLGYQVDQLPSLDPFYYFHPDDVHHIKQNAIDKLQAGEASITINYRLRHANGNYLWVESLTKYVYDDQNNIIAIQVSTRNITERKQAEEDIRSALEKEKELRDLKSRFIVMASHEFRTPLATIQSSLDLLEHYWGDGTHPNSDKTAKHFERIRIEIKRVTDLMNDILLLGKLEAGRAQLKIESTDLIELVNELIEENFTQTEDGRIPVFDYSGFPKPIYLDQQLIRHALSNLIANALKFSRGKSTPIIKLNYLKNKVRISVTDFGIGIPRNEKNRIFETFYRGSNTTEFQGTGLGLVITQEFVEMHQGKIWFESIPGKKTVFTIELNL